MHIFTTAGTTNASAKNPGLLIGCTDRLYHNAFGMLVFGYLL
jgi:hypothetical protein